MGSGGKPGVTFKATVHAKGGELVTFQAKAEDVEYFVQGQEYVIQATPVGPKEGE